MTQYLSQEEINNLPKECPSVFYEYDSSGMSPLHYAASNCNQMVLEIFVLMDKCDLDFPTTKGLTCLHLAVKSSRCTPEMVTFLLKHGCNPQAVTSEGKKPRDLTTNSEIISLLENAPKTLAKTRATENTEKKKRTKTK